MPVLLLLQPTPRGTVRGTVPSASHHRITCTRSSEGEVSTTMALSREEKADMLRRVDLFAALPEDVLAVAADHAVQVEFQAGRAIVRQGEVGTGLFVLPARRARVMRDG